MNIGVRIMESRVAKWGNSLGVRIPKALAKTLDLKENTVVDLSIENNHIVIAMANTYNLKDLLAGITKKNRHGEVSTGSPVGDEVW
jgi:antitoxin MazE